MGMEGVAPMVDERLARITEGQKDCLRLIFAHREIKEIARDLSIAPDTVKKRLEAARRVLGVDRSIDAARILAEAEGPGPYPPRVYPAQAVHNAAEIPPSPLTDHTGDGDRTATTQQRVRENLAVYEPPAPPPRRRARWPFPTEGSTTNDLNLPMICLWMLIIAIVVGVFALGLTMVGIATQDEITHAR